MIHDFWNEEDGIATVEILLILAVLIVIALLFRNAIINWVKQMLASIFPNTEETNVKPTQAPF